MRPGSATYWRYDTRTKHDDDDDDGEYEDVNTFAQCSCRSFYCHFWLLLWVLLLFSFRFKYAVLPSNASHHRRRHCFYYYSYFYFRTEWVAEIKIIFKNKISNRIFLNRKKRKQTAKCQSVEFCKKKSILKYFKIDF